MATVTADSLEDFPVIPNYGFSSSILYEIDAAQLEGGYEVVNRLWTAPLIEIAAFPLDDAGPEDIELLLQFYHAMGGRSTYFRVYDYMDYKSSGVEETIAFNDQPLIEIGSTGTYQLVKDYTAGSTIQRREIYKPVGDTVVAGNEVTAEQSDFEIDEGTGVLTPGGGFTGVPTTWGGEFKLEARFISTPTFEYTSWGSRSTSVTIRERRRVPTT